MKLYIYEHCPFCARVRYVAGMLDIDLNINILDYHDEQTPTTLIGKKSVPILLNGDVAKAESMDIIAGFLREKQQDQTVVVSEAVRNWQSDAFPLLQKIGYPRWVNLTLKEFHTEQSRTEWRQKKETSELNFDNLLKNTDIIVKQVNPLVERAFQLLSIQNGQSTLSLVEQAIIFSILRGLYSEPSINWGKKLDTWLQSQSSKTNISLLA
ncbi:Glutaredoxin 2 [invertebrate metagenome]|uniref:Glutaredoxin 2 n=1 Tax=invertebrate metagenome TaxID=1711999 RepID=A0A2H9T7I4_9ZZZZ